MTESIFKLKPALEAIIEEERREKEKVEAYKLHARVFNFVFKGMLGNLLFSRNMHVRDVNGQWLARFDLLHIPSLGKQEYFVASADGCSSFFMYMMFSEDECCRLCRYFPDFARRFESEDEFLYKEFPLKTIIEDALGKTILHLLDEPHGNTKIFTEDMQKRTKLLFSAANTEELMVKMDVE